ncbi:MAG: glycosyltransferase [Bacteroidales bacterium]|nr:glycosyltransferase [Bacteroidales bacterium]
MNGGKLLIVGNSSSVHTNNLKTLVGGYFGQVKVADSKNFSVRMPLKFIKSFFTSCKELRAYAPSFIILYQVDIAAFAVTVIKRFFVKSLRRCPVLVVGIGSDVLTVADKSALNRRIARYVINHGDYFNAGSVAIKEKMQQLASRPIKVLIANLGTDDILPQTKQDIVFSNRLHKDFYNIRKIIDAFAVFVRQAEYEHWKLVIAATGMETEFLNQARELGIEDKVQCVGWLDKQQNNYWYSVSKIWVSLPDSDSVSISLLEAMSAECFPVCSDVPALKGFLTDNINAVIVRDFEENFFKRAVDLMNDGILNRNRQQARDFADKEKNRQRFYSLFDEALKAEKQD